MKKNISFIVLVILLLLISGFIIFIITSKQDMQGKTFNIKSGDVLEFPEYETTVTVLHVASTLCKDEKKCFDTGEVEVSCKVKFNDEETSYTLKSKTNNQERIKNSNNYLLLSYKDNIITIEVKNKTEI